MNVTDFGDVGCWPPAGHLCSSRVYLNISVLFDTDIYGTKMTRPDVFGDCDFSPGFTMKFTFWLFIKIFQQLLDKL